MVFAIPRDIPSRQELSISPPKSQKKEIIDKIFTLFKRLTQPFSSNDPCLINELPQEMRSIIFSYAKNHSAVKCVCKIWLQEKNMQEARLCAQLKNESVSTLLGQEIRRFKHLPDDLFLKAFYQDLLDRAKVFPDMGPERPDFQCDSLKEFVENITDCPLIELCKNDKIPNLKAIAEGKQSVKNKAQALRERLRLFPDEPKAAMAINLSNRNLRALPREIELFTNVTFLNLFQNQLSDLPESSSIWKLTQLRDLNLGENPLTSISRSIDRLTELEELNIRGHQCTSLPESILEITVVTGRETCYNYF